MDHLTDLQQAALASLLELTGGGCEQDVAMSVLESVDWDVQKATEMIFDHPPPPRRARTPPPTHVMEEFEIDDSDQDPFLRPDRERPVRGEAAPLLSHITRPFISLLSLPFSLLTSLLRFVFNILRIPFPRFSGLTFISPLRRGGGPPAPSNREFSMDKWLRELEEETGAVSLGRLKAQGRSGVTSSTDSGPSASSNLTSRGTTTTIDGIPLDPSKTYLPDFLLTTYDAALQTAQRQSLVLCVFLYSEEHDSTHDFKRTVLTNTALISTLAKHNVLAWAAPTSSREGWSASQKLGATSFPFVAFIALQPPRASLAHQSSSSSSPVLTVLSRHQGSPATASDKLVDHITDQVIPRVSSYLSRLQAQQRNRELERQLREDQDRAFADAARRDRERIEARAREERVKEDERRRAVEEARVAEEQRKQEMEEAKRREETRMEWRRWTRRALVSPPSTEKGGLRIAVRLPTGSRVIHTFSPSATLTDLYAFVDASLIPPSLPPALDPFVPPPSVASSNSPLSASARDVLEAYITSSTTSSLPPSTTLSSTPSTPNPAQAYWNFTLASSFPRVALPWRSGVPLSEIPEVRGGGQVVVEMAPSPASSRPGSRVSRRSMESGGSGEDVKRESGEESDEYETESEDEEE